MSIDPTIAHLQLSSDPENVGLVRHVLGAVGLVAGYTPQFIADVKIAAGEACANVVQHAYDGRRGPMLVAIAASSSELEILVRDRGEGMQVHRPHSGRSLGAGLALIQALTQSVELRGDPGSGTDVLMRFGEQARMGRQPVLSSQDGFQPDFEPGQLTLRVAHGGSMLAPIYNAAASYMGARAQLRLEQLADVQLLCDLLASFSTTADDTQAPLLEIAAEPAKLSMRLGPFARDRIQELIHAGKLEGLKPLDALVQQMSVHRDGTADHLSLSVLG